MAIQCTCTCTSYMSDKHSCTFRKSLGQQLLYTCMVTYPKMYERSMDLDFLLDIVIEMLHYLPSYQFWDKSTEWSQNDIDNYMYNSKGASYFWYSCPSSQISLWFAMQPTTFKLTVVLRLDPLKWPWTLQCQGYPIYVLLVSPSPKYFTPFCP